MSQIRRGTSGHLVDSDLDQLRSYPSTAKFVRREAVFGCVLMLKWQTFFFLSQGLSRGQNDFFKLVESNVWSWTALEKQMPSVCLPVSSFLKTSGRDVWRLRQAMLRFTPWILHCIHEYWMNRWSKIPNFPKTFSDFAILEFVRQFGPLDKMRKSFWSFWKMQKIFFFSCFGRPNKKKYHSIYGVQGL